MAKKTSGKRGSLFSKTLFVFGAALIFFIFAIAGFILYSGYNIKKDKYKDVSKPARIAKVEKVPSSEAPPLRPHNTLRPRVAIVIDDMGLGMKPLRDLLEMDAAISVAVLPFLPHSKDTAEQAHIKGRDVLLHLPMEPKDSDNNDPGKGALFTNMSEAQVAYEVKRGIDAVPYIKGINNHMGSKFTEDEKLMRVALAAVKANNLFFLDSKTTGKSVAYRVAKEMDIKAASRQVFLDNEEDVDYTKAQILKLIEIAKKRGSAIAIGHPHPSTIAALKQMLPRLKKDVDIVAVSSLIDSIKE